MATNAQAPNPIQVEQVKRFRSELQNVRCGRPRAQFPFRDSGTDLRNDDALLDHNLSLRFDLELIPTAIDARSLSTRFRHVRPKHLVWVHRSESNRGRNSAGNED